MTEIEWNVLVHTYHIVLNIQMIIELFFNNNFEWYIVNNLNFTNENSI